MSRQKELLSVPTWEILAIAEELRDEMKSSKLLHDDDRLACILRQASHVLDTVIRDEVRYGRISESEYDKQKEMARHYLLCKYSDDMADVESSTVFDALD